MRGATFRRNEVLGRWGRWIATNWRKGLIIAGAITAVMAIGVAMVKPEFTYYSIMPENSPQVQDMKTIVDTFPSASSIIVVVQAPEGTPPDRAREIVTRSVDAIQRELGKPEYAQYVKSVQGQLDMNFYRAHGLMLAKADEIHRIAGMYDELDLATILRSLNDDLEREYVGNEDALSDDEETVTASFEGLGRILSLIEQAAQGRAVPASDAEAATEEFFLGSGYFLSRDSTKALLIVQPTFTLNDLSSLTPGVIMIDEGAKKAAAAVGADSGLTGLTVVAKDEFVTSEQGLEASTTIALIVILVLMILTFRMFSVPFISGIPLGVGIVWTVGVTGFLLGRLNIMTAMYMVALLGLGIDYAIHLLTTFVQERDAGLGFSDAVAQSFRKSGSGILLGALTTAVAFFALLVAKSDIVRELGVVAGVGIICELIAMFLLVPALLGWREHRRVRRGKGESRFLAKFSPGAVLLNGLGGGISRAPVVFAVLALVAGAALSSQAYKVEVEGNIMNMEAKGLQSVELQDLMVREFDMAPDFLSVTTTSLEDLRRLSDAVGTLPSVKRAESIVPYLPSDGETAARTAEIERLRARLSEAKIGGEVDAAALADEIDRLAMNITELADLAYFAGMDRLFATLNGLLGLDADGQNVAETPIDRLPVLLASQGSAGSGDAAAGTLAELQSEIGSAFAQTLLGMSSTDPITITELPPEIRDSYVSADGSRYLLNAIPRGNPWETDFRRVYTAQLESVTDKATGMLLASEEMYTIAEVDGVRAAIAAVIVIFLLLLIDFRNLKLAISTMLPLALSMGSLFGIMALTGIKFDFVNIIAVPLLIGMGVDDAVHIGHRYLYEGPGEMAKVVAKTGTAVLLTSLTTIVGFASFIPSPMRAMRSTGIVLGLAMALAFIFSVLFQPALLVILREKLKLSIEPWRKR